MDENLKENDMGVLGAGGPQNNLVSETIRDNPITYNKSNKYEEYFVRNDQYDMTNELEMMKRKLAEIERENKKIKEENENLENLYLQNQGQNIDDEKNNYDWKKKELEFIKNYPNRKFIKRRNLLNNKFLQIEKKLFNSKKTNHIDNLLKMNSDHTKYIIKNFEEVTKLGGRNIPNTTSE